MLKLTKTGIGLLTRQYRSVLHKCFLINVGLFALGAASVMVPNEAEAEEITVEDILGYLGTVTDDTATGTTGHVTWTNSGSSEVATTYDTSTNTATGTIKIGNNYYTYTYTKPSDYTETKTRVTSPTTSNSQNKTFYHISTSGSGGALSYGILSSIDIISDFVLNSASSNGLAMYTAGASYNPANIRGDFIGNRNNGSSYQSNGTLNNNGSTITSITGDFIGNYVSRTLYRNTYSSSAWDGMNYGGGIYNTGTIKGVIGNFINNKLSTTMTYRTTAGSSYLIEGTHNAYNYGGAIYNTGTIRDLTGNFIGNSVEAKLVFDTSTSGGYVISSSNFTLNKTSRGGAIYNTGTISLLAKDQDITFYDNKVINMKNTPTKSQSINSSSPFSSATTTTYNDIYNTSTINLNASSGKSINFGGTIEGSSGTLNINADATNYGGEYIFNNTVSGHTINLGSSSTASHPVTVKLGSVKQTNGSVTYGKFSSGSLVNWAEDSLLDMRNLNVDSNSLTNLTLYQPLKLALDANLTRKEVDTLSVTNAIGGTEGLVIDTIDTGGLEETIEIQLAKKASDYSKYSLSPDYKVEGALAGLIDSVTYDDTTGKLTFTTNNEGGSGKDQGRIHGLVEDMGDGTYTYHTTDMGDIVKSYANLAIGTTVEEDFLSLNSVIGGWNANDRTLESGNVVASHLVNKEISTEPGANNITTDNTSVGANLVRLDTAILEAEDKLNTDYYTKLEKRHNFREKEQNTSFRGSETTEESPLLLSGLEGNDKALLSHHTAQRLTRFLVNTRNDGMFFEADEPRRMRFSRRYAPQNDKSSSMVAANDNNLTTFKQAI